MFGRFWSLRWPARQHEHAGRVGVDHHLRDQLLHELEARDRAVELLALLRVLDRLVHAALADPDAAGRDAVAAAVERGHRDLEAVADPAQHLVVGDLDPVERQLGGVGRAQPELAVDLLRGEARAVGRHEEAGDAAVLLLRIGLGEDHRDLRVVAERDEHLRAGDRPAAVLLASRGWRPRRRRSRCPARSARSSRATRPSTAWAGARASAPRCPTARSSRRPARSARRRPCARTSRRARSPRRSARRRCSRGCGRRTPPRPARPGSPCRRCASRARGRSARRGRSRGRAG